MGTRARLKLGKKGLRKELGGWQSGWVQPSSKIPKRWASKRARRTKDLQNGTFYKKTTDWFEWC
jgi:hypothetical protein